jgi:serpin B
MKQKMLWAAVALMMTACSSDNDPIVNPENNEWTPIALTRAEQELVTNNNDFAFKLLRKVRWGDPAGPCDGPQKSMILSPISITYALGMLNNGAAGETQQQINKVLGFNNADEVNAFCKKMLTEAPYLDKLTKVQIANNIYMNKGYELKPAFVQKANNYYNALPETRDFADGKTLDVINQWASDHTEKMIEKVLNEEEFKTDAVSYLLNAIYFKGTWAERFKKEETKNEMFEHASPDKNLIYVPMMHLEHQFLYADKGDYEALQLPYGNGAYNMTILLPKEGKNINDVSDGLTAESWKNMWRSGMPDEGAIVDVKLPRFETETDQDLNETMSFLGMPNAFDSQKAEFPDFCNVPTYIGLMKQVARIKVSEEGTEAAAVTVVETLEKACLIGPIHVDFHADHPFIYIISEQSTGAIFFIGQYTGF